MFDLNKKREIDRNLLRLIYPCGVRKNRENTIIFSMKECENHYFFLQSTIKHSFTFLKLHSASVQNFQLNNHTYLISLFGCATTFTMQER